MSLDTTAANRLRNHFDNHQQVWLFGYGSLIFKADFPFSARRPASVSGWTRRFWQGSHDHRGTALAPGRVLTLVPQSESICSGMAYLIGPEVVEQLDYREKNGYLRVVTPMQFDDGSGAEGLTYIADAENGAYLGPASELQIARQIAAAVGPSGPNRDYLRDLANALRAMGKDDAHVFGIERLLNQVLGNTAVAASNLSHHTN